MSEHTSTAATHQSHPGHGEAPHGADHSHGHGVAQEPDDVPVGKVLKVGFWGVAVTLLCIGLSVIFLHDDEARVPAPVAHTSRLDDETKGMGILELDLYYARGDRPNGPAQQLKAAKEAELGSYGWIDEKAGIIHIPIDRAYDRVIDGYGQKK
jgi:hypothetical protein